MKQQRLDQLTQSTQRTTRTYIKSTATATALIINKNERIGGEADLAQQFLFAFWMFEQFIERPCKSASSRVAARKHKIQY